MIPPALPNAPPSPREDGCLDDSQLSLSATFGSLVSHSCHVSIAVPLGPSASVGAIVTRNSMMQPATTSAARRDPFAIRTVGVDDFGRPFTSWSPLVDRTGRLVGFHCGQDDDLWENASHVARDTSEGHSPAELGQVASASQSRHGRVGKPNNLPRDYPQRGVVLRPGLTFVEGRRAVAAWLSTKARAARRYPSTTPSFATS